MPVRKFALAVAISIAVAGCGSGGGGATNNADSGAGVTLGSSASASSSTAVYTEKGVTYAATAGVSASGGTEARVLTLPNNGQMAAGARMVNSMVSESITTTIPDVNGVAVDPANDIGAAYGTDSGVISVFRLSTREEVAAYDTKTLNTLFFPGARTTKITGIVMESSTRTMIIGTADGYELVDYAEPALPKRKMEVPSTEADSNNGVEIIENFAYDSKLTIGNADHRMIITGGKERGDYAMVLVDAATGIAYRPDAATNALIQVDKYLDAAAVDTAYHVAVFADENVGTVFVDLNQLTLDNGSRTFSLPASAVSRSTKYTRFTNIAIDSSQHMVMMGEGGYYGTGAVVAELQDPLKGLGFKREAVITMPDGTDDTGGQVIWKGATDPHGATAYTTGPGDPSYAQPASMGVLVNGSSTHIAIINLKKVLDGALSGAAYDPQSATPRDISYFKIP